MDTNRVQLVGDPYKGPLAVSNGRVARDPGPERLQIGWTEPVDLMPLSADAFGDSGYRLVKRTEDDPIPARPANLRPRYNLLRCSCRSSSAMLCHEPCSIHGVSQASFCLARTWFRLWWKPAFWSTGISTCRPARARPCCCFSTATGRSRQTTIRWPPNS